MMTDRETLEKTLKLWEYLATHPNEVKEIAYLNLMLDIDINSCSLCEQAYDWGKGPDCNRCLLRNFWPEGDCQHKDSPYTKWSYAERSTDRTLYANQIADAARHELMRLHNDG